MLYAESTAFPNMLFRSESSTGSFLTVCASITNREVVNDINVSMAKKSPGRALLSNDYYKLGGISLRKVDLASLAIFPIVFLAFNVGYWAHYTILLQGRI